MENAGDFMLCVNRSLRPDKPIGVPVLSLEVLLNELPQGYGDPGVLLTVILHVFPPDFPLGTVAFVWCVLTLHLAQAVAPSFQGVTSYDLTREGLVAFATSFLPARHIESQ